MGQRLRPEYPVFSLCRRREIDASAGYHFAPIPTATCEKSSVVAV